MPRSTESLQDEATQVLRDLAVHHGLAYTTYGETLQEFGENKIGWADLFKTSSDIYFKEVAHTYWALLKAEFDVYTSMMAGSKTLHPEAETEPKATAAAKPAQRGRR
jgi:hypothetical protein